MTGSLEKIERAFQEFSAKVAHCRDETRSDMADIQDAYSRLVRLRERYKHEAPALGSTAKAALSKVFDNDPFIEGMCKARVIGDHVKAKEPVLRHIDNSPIEITASTSGATLFAGRCVELTDTRGQRHRIDHLAFLTEAETRIARAIANARAAFRPEDRDGSRKTLEG
jgi:hypothetical protein